MNSRRKVRTAIIQAALVVAAISSLLAKAQGADSIAGISQQLLDEVVVTAKTPAVKVTPDKTVYDLKSTVMGQSGTLLDALSSIPGVSVTTEGAVSLYGNRGATININGKKCYLKGRELANYLRSLPASTVGTVSLRTTANAKDDASDKNGIIEITTRRVRERGFTLGINGGASAWRNLRGNGSLNLSYNSGRSEFSLLYSFFASRQRIRLNINRHYISDENRMLQLSLRRRSDNANTVKGSWRYRLSSASTVTSSLSYSRNCRNEFGRMDSSIPVLSENDRSDNHTGSRWRNIMADICLDHRFSSGAEISVNFNHFRYNTREHQLLETSSPDTLRSYVGGRVRWYIDRIDYSQPLGGDFRLQAGVKNTIVSIRNAGSYSDLTAGEWVPNHGLSSSFRYRANTNAAYTQISFKHGGLAATVGARLEHERLKGSFSGNEAAPDTAYRVNTLDIVPTAEVRYLFPSGPAVMLSYSRRIERPNYADLNPFIYVFDEYTHAGGNINLHQSTSDNIQLGFSFANRLQAALFLTRSDDAIMKGYHEISDRCVYVAAENLPYFLQTGLRLVLANQNVGRRWSLTATATMLYNRYDWMDGTTKESTRCLTPLLNLENRFDLGAGWNAELSGNYSGKMAYGQVMLSQSGNMNMAVRKSFCHGSASLTLFVRDILATDRSKTIIRLGSHRAFFKENEFKRITGLSFSYKFHAGRKTPGHKEHKGPEELERL